MSLDPKQFAELVSTSRLADLDTSARDGRRARRFNYRTTLRIAPVTDKGPGEFFDVELEDFSVRGVRILDRAPLDPGSQFILEFPHADGSVVPILCTVAFCAALSSHHYAIGAEFTCVVPARVESLDAEAARLRQSMLD